MWIDTAVFKEDLTQIINDRNINWQLLQNKSVLITGATGLIGYTLVSALLYSNIIKKNNITVFALVRSIDKAKTMFCKQLNDSQNLVFIEGSVESFTDFANDIDYIIHCASPTGSKFFVEQPVDTVKTIVCGTINMLELAKIKSVKGFLYLSSMEVYGAPQSDVGITELSAVGVSSMSVRSCYPQAKLMCENLCVDYFTQYNVPAKVIRLAQTFGPGVSKNDNRVFAQFAKAALDKQDIVLQTNGQSKRTYLYTADAVSAIIMTLLHGENGEVYNASNESTFCSIKDMAQKVACLFPDSNIKVRILNDAELSNKYPPQHSFNIVSNKLKHLGWTPRVGLEEMYIRMIAAMTY